MEVAELLARLIGRPDIAPTITRQFRKGDVRHCTADLTRARRLLDQYEALWRTRIDRMHDLIIEVADTPDTDESQEST